MQREEGGKNGQPLDPDAASKGTQHVLQPAELECVQRRERGECVHPCCCDVALDTQASPGTTAHPAHGTTIIDGGNQQAQV